MTIKNPLLADTTVYDIIEAGMVVEGLKILAEQNVFIMSDVYQNLYVLLFNFRQIYGQTLKRVELQAHAQAQQCMEYGKKHKRKCKGKAKCNCR